MADMLQPDAITPKYREHLDRLHGAAVKAIGAGISPARTVKRLRWDYQNAWWTNEPAPAAKATREANRRRMGRTGGSAGNG